MHVICIETHLPSQSHPSVACTVVNRVQVMNKNNTADILPMDEKVDVGRFSRSAIGA